MTNTFNWVPDMDAGIEHEPRIIETVLGDGYSQRMKDGINNNPIKADFNFANRLAAEADAISDFLENEGGVTAFYYTHPRDIQRLWVCKKWKQVDNGNLSSVSATFEEVPG